jgi:hypothetical protein
MGFGEPGTTPEHPGTHHGAPRTRTPEHPGTARSGANAVRPQAKIRSRGALFRLSTWRMRGEGLSKPFTPPPP